MQALGKKRRRREEEAHEEEPRTTETRFAYQSLTEDAQGGSLVQSPGRKSTQSRSTHRSTRELGSDFHLGRPLRSILVRPLSLEVWTIFATVTGRAGTGVAVGAVSSNLNSDSSTVGGRASATAGKRRRRRLSPSLGISQSQAISTAKVDGECRAHVCVADQATPIAADLAYVAKSRAIGPA